MELGRAFSLLCALLLASNVWAAGTLKLDSSGFMRHTPGRSYLSSTIALGPEFEEQWSRFETNVDFQFVAFLNDPDSATIESQNLYIATSKRWFPKHQITLGRRHFSWNAIDSRWRFGLHSPRFTWDPLHPDEVGLTGAFYSYGHGPWRLTAFASPISVPERGYPVRVHNNQLVAESPLWVPPLESVPVMNRRVPIHYDLVMPGMNELVMNPGAALQLGYQPDLGVWTSITAAALPIHQADFAMETGLNPHTKVVETTLYPRILRHKMLTGEVGFRDRVLGVWGSFTYENPEGEEIPDFWVARSVGPSLISGIGLEVFRLSRLSFDLSYLSVAEDNIKSDEAEMLPSRWAYQHATQVRTQLQLSPRFSVATRWIRDLEFSSDFMSADLGFRVGSKPYWNVGVGADLISAYTAEGVVGQYVGDDRIRGSLSYAF